MQKKNYEIDMCNGAILPKLLLFSLPLLFSGVLQLLFNTADIIVVGQFAGDDSVAAVGSNTALINLLTNFFMGFSVGANVLTAKFFGSKQQKDLKETTHTAMLLSICSGIILTLIGCIGAERILIWMDTPKELLSLATLYLRIYFIGMTSTMIYNFGSAILRAKGDTQRPLYYLTFAGIINVSLNLIFVILLKMDVAGVATATVISQTISALLVLRCMMKDGLLSLKELKFYPEKIKEIVRIGLPASFQGIIFSATNVIIQASVNGFGDTVVTGNSAAANLEGFVWISMNSFHQATISFTSQNLGAKKYDRIIPILWQAEVAVTVVGIVLGFLVYELSPILLKLYTDTPEVIEIGKVRLGVICRSYALCGIMDTIVGSIRGLGATLTPTIVSLVGVCGLRLIWIFTLFRMEQFHSTWFLYLTYPVSWGITIVAHIICFFIIFNNIKRKANTNS